MDQYVKMDQYDIGINYDMTAMRLEVTMDDHRGIGIINTWTPNVWFTYFWNS